MFSQIGIVDIARLFLFSDKGRGTLVRQLRIDLDWLLEHDVIFDPEKSLEAEMSQMMSMPNSADWKVCQELLQA